MKSSPPRLNPKTDLIVSRYLRFPAFFFGRFLPQTCPFAQTFRFISTAQACPNEQNLRIFTSPQEYQIENKLTIIKKMIIKGTEVNFNEYRK